MQGVIGSSPLILIQKPSGYPEGFFLYSAHLLDISRRL